MIDAARSKHESIIPREITIDQARDTGQAMVLLCLIVIIVFKQPVVIWIALVVLLINMVRPQLYKPLAKWWFALSNLLSRIVPRILLGILFYGMVTPVGLLRRVLGKDPLQLKKWKKGRESVLRARNHTLSAKDIINPF
jgi:polyferredoxin